MKTETTFNILFFFSCVFISVVSAKPSPELMKELTALEKYLERKEGFDTNSVWNENKGEQKTVDSPFGEGQDNNEEDQSHSDKEDADADKNKKPTEPPAEPEADKSSGKSKEDVVPEGSGINDQDSTSDGGEGEEKKPQENNKVSDSNEEKESDKLFRDLNKVISNLKDATDELATLFDRFRQVIKNDDDDYSLLKVKYDQAIEKSNQKLGELKTDIEDIKGVWEKSDASGKKSVRENTASRKRQLSNTEFLNIVQSLLTKN